jgi:hypothetical protein
MFEEVFEEVDKEVLEEVVPFKAPPIPLYREPSFPIVLVLAPPLAEAAAEAAAAAEADISARALFSAMAVSLSASLSFCCSRASAAAAFLALLSRIINNTPSMSPTPEIHQQLDISSSIVSQVSVEIKKYAQIYITHVLFIWAALTSPLFVLSHYHVV